MDTDIEAISILDPRATKPSLLLRIRDATDSASWNEFAEIYGPIIRSYCRRRGLQPTDADDVVQEILTRVARSIGTFEYEPGRGRFRDWLGTVTRNRITRFFEIEAPRRLSDWRRCVRTTRGACGGSRMVGQLTRSHPRNRFGPHPSRLRTLDLGCIRTALVSRPPGP